jgi:hypothetical protein
VSILGPDPFHALVLFSFVFVCRDLVASCRRQRIVFGRRRLKLVVRRDEQDREARRVGEGEKGVRAKYLQYLEKPGHEPKLDWKSRTGVNTWT